MKDARFKSKMVKFVRASMKGWSWAIKNQNEAVDILLKYDTSGKLNKDKQIKMMREVAKLIGKPDCKLSQKKFK